MTTYACLIQSLQENVSGNSFSGYVKCTVLNFTASIEWLIFQLHPLLNSLGCNHRIPRTWSLCTWTSPLPCTHHQQVRGRQVEGEEQILLHQKCQSLILQHSLKPGWGHDATTTGGRRGHGWAVSTGLVEKWSQVSSEVMDTATVETTCWGWWLPWVLVVQQGKGHLPAPHPEQNRWDGTSVTGAHTGSKPTPDLALFLIGVGGPPHHHHAGGSVALTPAKNLRVSGSYWSVTLPEPDSSHGAPERPHRYENPLGHLVESIYRWESSLKADTESGAHTGPGQDVAACPASPRTWRGTWNVEARTARGRPLLAVQGRGSAALPRSELWDWPDGPSLQQWATAGLLGRLPSEKQRQALTSKGKKAEPARQLPHPNSNRMQTHPSKVGGEEP